MSLPDHDAMLRRHPAVQHFWTANRDLLTAAWEEWDQAIGCPPGESMIAPALRAAVADAWSDTRSESAVQSLIEELAPDVYRFQLFAPDRLADFRRYLNEVWDAGIPLRPPYGILLNRGGAMLDPRSVGHLAAPGFQNFYRMVMNRYMRPIGRLLFPLVAGFDTQTFGFSISYKPTTEASIQPHTDASAVTLNVNLNTPDEAFTGSEVDFVDQRTGGVASVIFEPGIAVIHRGDVPHRARPITSGERSNLVLWLYGDRGALPWSNSPSMRPIEIDDPSTRWTIPDTGPDTFAPF